MELLGFFYYFYSSESTKFRKYRLKFWRPQILGIYNMSLAAHQFGLVEFWILNISCRYLQAGAMEKIKTDIQNMTFDTFKWMSCLGHYNKILLFQNWLDPIV